jgi:hypothetical protein
MAPLFCFGKTYGVPRLWLIFCLDSFSFAENTNISVNDVINAPDLEALFSLPLSLEVFQEFQQLQLYLQAVSYDEDSADQWSFIWGNANYTSSRIYRFVFSGMQAQPTFKWLWKSKCIPRINSSLGSCLWIGSILKMS